uniref:Transposon protein, putative, Mutator sub-class n=1 Tax=Oryza sativa subsp. japonica TaxID=39947 RepID=Q2QQU7_ORYSJ|nr:transposon protein, putative, Mutator sub-class [Oryza sativa Japonica Group]
MDVQNFLVVQFHYNGEFIYDGRQKHYCGGSEAIPRIDRDKVSLPEVKGHLKDHCAVEEPMLLHWLFPMKELKDGLRVLLDDKVCQLMSDCTSEAEVADIYVETQVAQEDSSDAEDVGSDNDSDFEDEIEEISSDEEAAKIFEVDTKGKKPVMIVTSIPDKTQGQIESLRQCHNLAKKDKEEAQVVAHNDQLVPYSAESDSNSDSDYLEDSDGQLITKRSKYPRFRGSSSSTPTFTLGQLFDCKKEFKDAVIKHALANRRYVKFVKDEGDRVRAKCEWKLCPWVCLLKKTSRTNSWQITSFTDGHTCPQRKDNPMVTSTRIAEKYEKMIRDNPTWSIKNMISTVSEEMFANASVPQCKRAKAHVLKKLYDATRCEYSRIFDYQLELLRSNPGSIVVVTLDSDSPTPVFHRIYVCLNACKKRFLAGCRRVVGLDGCFFKGSTNGELLCALGRDANNQMYPIAWAIVEKETNDSWDWFCALLFKDLVAGDGDGWVVISDQQKGIINAVETWIPKAEHRNCARHIYANWRKKFKNREWQKKFWRFLPIISMLEAIRRKVMVRIHEHRTKMEKWIGPICPNILKKLNAYVTEYGFCHAISNGNDKFEVKHHEQRFTVNLQSRTCSCRYWQLAELPCCHAIACIHYKTNSLDEYIASCYSVKAFMSTYEHCLEPVEGIHSWPVSKRPKPAAPPYVKMPGRPKKERRREPHEKPKATRVSKVGTIIRCRRCKGIGHNKTTCAREMQALLRLRLVHNLGLLTRRAPQK